MNKFNKDLTKKNNKNECPKVEFRTRKLVNGYHVTDIRPIGIPKVKNETGSIGGTLHHKYADKNITKRKVNAR